MGPMTRSLLPIAAALVFPFALLLLVTVIPLIALVILARAAPPGPFRALARFATPPDDRSPPIL